MRALPWSTTWTPAALDSRATNAESTYVVPSASALTVIVASPVVSAGESKVRSSCSASASAWSVKTVASAAGSAGMTAPPVSSAMPDSAFALAAVLNVTTSTRTPASRASLVATSKVASLPVSAPSDRTSSDRDPSSPTSSTASRMAS